MLVAVKGTVARRIPLTSTGFTMVFLTVDGQQRPFIGGGDLGAMAEKDSVVVIGREEKNPKYGPQTKVIRWWYESDCPFQNTDDAEKTITFLLDELKLPPKTAENIFDAYLDQAEGIIRQNPYQIVTDGLARKININTIDKYIAPYLSIGPTDKRRLGAAIVSLLKRSRGLHGAPPFIDDSTGTTHGSPGGGHVFLDFTQVVGICSDDMELPRKLVAEEVRRLAVTPRNPIDERPLLNIEKSGESDRYVYSHTLNVAERGLAHHVRRISSRSADLIPDLNIQSNVKLSDEQEAAVRMALNSPLSIITGGPGVGKTTITSALTMTLRKLGKNFLLCAPTGVASRRIEKATSEPAQTIHRLLKIDPGRGVFQMGPQQPLQTNFVICDESSMVDLPLMYSLFSAVADGTQVLIVGDADQLPPVGPGYPLRDLIKWGKIPTAKLSKIYRQEMADSLIIRGSRDILLKQTPVFGKDSKTEDMFRFHYKRESEAIKTVVELATKKIQETFAIPPRQVQILCPLRRRTRSAKKDAEPSIKILSAENVNLEMQKAIHGRSPGEDEKFFVGDRVIHTKNNYDLDVMNGEVGYVINVNKVEHTPKTISSEKPKTSKKITYQVEFDGRKVIYDAEASKELQLAYALSVHKAQGTESTAVIVLAYPVPNFFSRNMLYTAITRGKRVVIVLTPSDGSAKKILQTDETSRNSLLTRWLEEQPQVDAEFPPIKLDEISGDED